MLKKRLKWLLASSLVAYAGFSQAGFVFHLNSGSCNSIAGEWNGTGKVSNWLIGECAYQGTGLVSTVDASGNFTIAAKALKKSGSSICPKKASQELKALCDNGVVTVKTDFGDLQGQFSDHAGNASGTLSVSPGIEADVYLSFTR